MNMKKVIKLVSKLSILTLLTTCSMNSFAQNHQSEGLTCESKKQAIQAEIEQAKNHNNSHKVTGLEKALDEVNTHCSNANLESKYKQDIAEKTDKVAERKNELAQKTEKYAKDSKKFDQEKIDKLKAKVQKAEQELADAKQKLADYYQQVAVK